MERAAAVTPSPRQVAWQRLEFQVFVHFGVNTFTNREWGEGDEDPSIFNPTDLDAGQWALAAKEAGAKAIVLVAKHHDGFCLWPTAQTPHSVKSSPWRGGKGDVVREVSDACRAHGLKFGVYLSPADSHEPTYGQSDRYNRFFLDQLRELLTNYGPIHEVWFDGATPKDKGQVYDYQAWYALIRELQPGAVIFGRGPDVRWVGNEAGHGRASEWSVVALPGPIETCRWPDLTEPDLGSLGKLKSVAGGQYLHWYPAETDTSIRPGWFYHRDQDARVRSLDALLNVYYSSVGNNCVLLLNVPPDTRGRFHENDVARMRELGAVLKATFGTNAAASAAAESESVAADHGAGLAIDRDLDTYWTTQDWEPEPVLSIGLAAPRRFNVISLQEHIPSGQRVEKFAVDVWDAARWATMGSGWNEVAEATTIGARKLIRIPTVESDRVRIRFLASRVRPTLAEVGLFLEPARLAAPSISRDRAGNVVIQGGADAAAIVYTTDGSEPGDRSTRYERPIPLPGGGVIRARAIAREPSPIPAQIGSASFDVCKAKWKVASVSSEEAGAGEGAANAIDDRPDTIWHSRWSSDVPRSPHELVIDLGETLTLRGFTYLPRANGPNGRVVKYEVYTSADGGSWGQPAAAGEFGNMRNNPVEQRVTFAAARPGRFLRFVALSEVNGQPWASAAEIGVITRD